MVGAVALRAIVRSVADGTASGEVAAWSEGVQRELTLGGMLAGFVLLGCDLFRAWHQTYAFFGGFEPITLELVQTITSGTLWGDGWKLQTIAAGLAAMAFAAAYRSWPGAWLAVYPAVVAATVSLPFTGHAVEQGSWLSLSAILQAVHVAAAATWVGTLAAVVLVGLRRAARLKAPSRPRVIAATVNEFSPVALSAVTALFIAGAATSFMYVGSFAAIFGTMYGQVLLVKVLGFAAVAATGFFNWQRVRPTLDAAADVEESGDSHVDLPESLLWRAAGIEVALAVVVLAVTAVLVALPLPTG